MNRYDHGFYFILESKLININESGLMKAAQTGSEENVNILFKFSNKNLKSFNGWTAYDYAMAEEHIELAEILKI